MTHETLSALVDGECSPQELDSLLDRMDKDPSLKLRYSRMVLAREARDTRLRRADPGFAARILAALDGEVPSNEVPAANPRVVALRPRLPVATWLRPAAGLAMAAGLGALAVLSLRPDTTPAPVTVASGPAMPESAGSTAPAEAVEVGQRRWNQLDPTDAERLNGYLIAYSQSRAQQGMGNTLGYARFAAHTAEYRPQRIQGPAGAPESNDAKR